MLPRDRRGRAMRTFLKYAAIMSLLILYLDTDLIRVAGRLGWMDIHEPAYSPHSLILVGSSLIVALILAGAATFADHKRRSMLAAIACPKCGAPVRARTARRGRYSGQKFFGCSRYPDCNGILSISAAEKALTA
jgi:hypothetical protein